MLLHDWEPSFADFALYAKTKSHTIQFNLFAVIRLNVYKKFSLWFRNSISNARLEGKLKQFEVIYKVISWQSLVLRFRFCTWNILNPQSRLKVRLPQLNCWNLKETELSKEFWDSKAWRSLLDSRNLKFFKRNFSEISLQLSSFFRRKFSCRFL